MCSIIIQSSPKIAHNRQALYKFHAQRAKQIFYKHIKGYIKHLDHMCITVALPDGTLMMQSPIPDMEDSYYATRNAKGDFGLSSKMYKNNLYYCWKDATTNPYGEEIRETIYGLYNGYFIVRKIGDIYIICGIASHVNDPRMTTVFFHNVNKISVLCDFYYTSLYHCFTEHTDHPLPKIQSFVPLVEANLFDKIVEQDERINGIALSKKDGLMLLKRPCLKLS